MGKGEIKGKEKLSKNVLDIGNIDDHVYYDFHFRDLRPLRCAWETSVNVLHALVSVRDRLDVTDVKEIDKPFLIPTTSRWEGPKNFCLLHLRYMKYHTEVLIAKGNVYCLAFKSRVGWKFVSDLESHMKEMGGYKQVMNAARLNFPSNYEFLETLAIGPASLMQSIIDLSMPDESRWQRAFHTVAAHFSEPIRLHIVRDYIARLFDFNDEGLLYSESFKGFFSKDLIGIITNWRDTSRDYIVFLKVKKDFTEEKIKRWNVVNFEKILGLVKFLDINDDHIRSFLGSILKEDKEDKDDKDEEEAQTQASSPTPSSYRASTPAPSSSKRGGSRHTRVIRGNKLLAANAGDSRCVISRKGQAYNLSRDHKPELEAERERILKAGQFVHAGRVNGSLNLARAIGDMEFKQNKLLPVEKQIVTANPDINAVELCDDDDFIVLACDGIWEDCMSSQQCVDFVQEQLNTELSLVYMNMPVTEQACLCGNLLPSYPLSHGRSLPWPLHLYPDPTKKEKERCEPSGDAKYLTKLSAVCEKVLDRCLVPSTAGGDGCDNMTVIISVQGTDGKWIRIFKPRVIPLRASYRSQSETNFRKHRSRKMKPVPDHTESSSCR